MNYRAIGAIVRKDLKVVLRSKATILPLVFVPVLLLLVLPLLAGAAANRFTITEADRSDLDAVVKHLPQGLQQNLEELDARQRIVVFLMVYMLAPMYLMVPLVVASVVAADSFAGEKERKTLEALLYTPTTDRELLFGKMLSAWVPAVLVGLGGFVLYCVAANAAAWPVMGRIFFPNLMWFVLALWVGPAVAALGMGVMVLVSARVGTFQEAYQLGSVVVLPTILLVVGQASGAIYLSAGLAAMIGLGLWLFDALLLWIGSLVFRRNRLSAWA